MLESPLRRLSIMTCGIRFLARLSSLVVGAALVLYASPAPLVAQGQATTGIIRGVVTDPNGAPVANASVILHEAQTNFTRTLTTDVGGNFTGTLLPLGTYDVTARSVGFAEVKRTGISLGVGETVALRLPLAAVTLAAVTVEATRPVVDVTKAESSTPLAADVVSGLPNNGRNYLNLTLLTPNVAIVQGPDGDELTVAGQRGIHNNVAVDEPDFSQNQFGFTLGGPIKRDRAFFFVAYDQQIYDEVKQKSRPQSLALDSLRNFLAVRYPGLANDFGPISRTNDGRAALAKFDFRLSDRHNLSLKYNYTWSEQKNGTFDVDAWGASANGLERDRSHAVNGSLVSFLSSRTSNEFRFQYSREDRPRPYNGPINPVSSAPFKDTGMDFVNGFRLGMPFFLPIKDHDTRLQVLDNVSIARGSHLWKFGGEWNRTETNQTFIGFANGRMFFNGVTGFINYVTNGSGYRTCSGAPGFTITGVCPLGQTITGPVLLYLQFAGVGGLSVDAAGTQSIVQNEFALYAQDTWKPSAKWTVNYGLRWEAQVEPDPITPPSQVFFAPFIGQTVINTQGTFTFPSDGTIPSDGKMFQPRLGFAYDIDGTGRQVLRGNVGVYYARIPGLNLASSRSTNGSIGQTLSGGLFAGNAATPAYDSLLAPPGGVPNHPTVFVFDKDFQNPRTFSASIAYDREIASDLALSLSYTHARSDHLTRFIDRNDPVFGSPWATGLPGGNGIFQFGGNGSGLVTVESSAKSRYNGITVGLRRVLDPNFQFDLNYTLSFDKSDDDNERDPFTFRYAQADSLQREYNWSDRDQRHRFNGWLLAQVAGFAINNRVSISSAQPVSEKCGVGNVGNGQRAATPQDRICRDGTAPDSGRILLRNTLRKDNAYFSWDVRVSRAFSLGRPGQQLEAIVEVFNVTGKDNFKDPAYGGLLFNFDGTIRSGLGDPRQLQAGVRWVF